MAIGAVKWFDAEKGFVRPHAGSEDVFVHLSAVDGGASCGLTESDRGEPAELGHDGCVRPADLTHPR